MVENISSCQPTEYKSLPKRAACWLEDRICALTLTRAPMGSGGLDIHTRSSEIVGTLFDVDVLRGRVFMRTREGRYLEVHARDVLDIRDSF